MDNLIAGSNGSSKFNEDTTERTVRNTKSCVSDEYYISPAIDNIAFLFGVTLIAENVLMICVIFRNRVLHTNSNILVASLAFTDVMIGIQCLVMGLNARTNLRSWMRHRPTQQRVFHSFIAAANYGLVMISMVHLAVLSVDRYLFVRWPFRYSRRITRRRVLTTAIGIWTIGIIYIIVSVVSYLDPKLHVNCIVVNAPFAYAGGPLLCVYLISLIVVIVSTAGLSKLAMDSGRKRGILKGYDADQYTGKKKTQERLDQNIPLAIIPTGFTPSLALQMIICIINDDMPNTHSDRYHPGGTADTAINEIDHLHNSDPRVNHNALCGPKRNRLQERSTSFDKNTTLGNAEQNNSTLNVKRCADGVHRFEASRIGMKETLVTNSYDSCSGRVNEIKHIRIPLRTSHSLTKDKDTRDEGNKKLLRRTKFKILKFVLVILGCYLVCTFPSIIRIIMIDLAHIDKLSETVEHASGLMLMANSGMNFLIMTQLNRDFRAALVKSFNCVKCFSQR